MSTSHCTASPCETCDRATIRDLIECWVVWRDSGDWERFRTLWHDDGRMAATWTQSPVDEFIESSRRAQANGMNVVHFLGGQAIDVAGDRAISQTKMTISERGSLEGVVCDIVCIGRFFDFLERRAEPLGPRFPSTDLRKRSRRSGRHLATPHPRSRTC